MIEIKLFLGKKLIIINFEIFFVLKTCFFCVEIIEQKSIFMKEKLCGDIVFMVLEIFFGCLEFNIAFFPFISLN